MMERGWEGGRGSREGGGGTTGRASTSARSVDGRFTGRHHRRGGEGAAVPKKLVSMVAILAVLNGLFRMTVYTSFF